MKIDIHREVEIEPTIRTELLSSMFEVPAKTKLSVSLSGDLPLDDRPWSIGLIVGPSGSGKTLLLNNLFGGSELLHWEHKSVIDDFAADHSMGISPVYVKAWVLIRFPPTYDPILYLVMEKDLESRLQEGYFLLLIQFVLMNLPLSLIDK